MVKDCRAFSCILWFCDHIFVLFLFCLSIVITSLGEEGAGFALANCLCAHTVQLEGVFNFPPSQWAIKLSGRD